MGERVAPRGKYVRSISIVLYKVTSLLCTLNRTILIAFMLEAGLSVIGQVSQNFHNLDN